MNVTAQLLQRIDRLEEENRQLKQAVIPDEDDTAWRYGLSPTQSAIFNRLRKTEMASQWRGLVSKRNQRMSYRIHRAMGYGMKWDDFCKWTTLPLQGYDLVNGLYEVFDSVTAEDINVPEGERKRVRAIDGLTNILSPNIIAPDGNGADLLVQAQNPDNMLAVLFLPNSRYSKEWYSFDSHLDYVFEANRRDRSEYAQPRDFIKELRHGIHPFGGFFMEADGTPYLWDGVTEFPSDRKVFPGIPSEIRWYLKKINVLDDKGVNELRPMMAQYWC